MGELAAGRVSVAFSVAKQRERADSRIAAAGVVKDEHGSSNGRILCAGRVEQQRRSAHCRIGTPVVEDQRSAANTSVKTAVGIGKERTPTKPCISSAGG